jgi:peptidoglycan/xylan/chitin deacetylase (PgdA/CDA1 family)
MPSDRDSLPVVLTFHRLSPKFSFSSTNYSPRRFRQLLEHLRFNGYQFASTNMATSKDTAAPVLKISFDDGYLHLWDYLPALMEEFSFQPLVFMPTGWIGKANSWDYTYLFGATNHLDRSLLRELSELGVEFGSHGHSHTDLTSLEPKHLEEELVRSRSILEELTGKEVVSISYPFGRHNEPVRAAARKAGYDYGYSMRFPQGSDTNLSRGRIAVYGYDTPFSVERKLSTGPLRRLEQWKGSVTNGLSGGTIEFNRLFRRNRLQA